MLGPFTSSSTFAITVSTGPNAVHCFMVASSTRPRWMKGWAMARAASQLQAIAKLISVPKWSSGTSRPAATASSCTRSTPTRSSSGVMN
jgi:hypothetical protein